jgi:hypothetical protein
METCVIFCVPSPAAFENSLPVERDSFIGLLVGSWEVLKLQPTFQTKSENYGYSGGDLTVLLIVLGDGFSPRFNLRSRS